ncbi:DDE-type integrase/transposase/recombinase, partial [Bacillus altitudinis]
YYLSAIQDLYNNEIVAWKLSKRNDLELVMETLGNLTSLRDVKGALLHSDQGFQYTTKAYQKRLENVGLKIKPVCSGRIPSHTGRLGFL